MTTKQYPGNFQDDNWGRRDFVTTIAAALGGVYLSAMPMASMPKGTTSLHKDFTVQQVIDIILKSIKGAPFKDTVDTIKSGNAGQSVKGIVTTMFATDEVIEKTIKLGANFIIAHEPTFYNHADNTSWLEQDEVYRFKKDLLDSQHIVVWRFHDYWHSHQPDGIRYGVLKSLGWENKMDEHGSALIEVPAMSLQQIITHLKKQLGIHTVKVIGDLSMMCSRIAILPGMSGGEAQIRTFEKTKPHLLICGELNEWETSEYIRDAIHQGIKTSLIVTGHALSEEPGMEWLVEWLRPQVPGITVTHIPSGDPFTYL
jgi:putative NIF3 family GTP cyclohydrolase 1 type 2